VRKTGGSLFQQTIKIRAFNRGFSMNLHEYQSKQVFAEYKLPVGKGIACKTADEAAEAIKQLDGDAWVAKCQVHAGGRGKAGGVKLVRNEVEVREHNEQYFFEIKFVGTRGIPANMTGLKSILEEIKPAHLGINYVFTFATWGEVKKRRWGDIKKLTWDGVRHLPMN